MKKTGEEYSILYDYYGALLSERQREVFEQYNEENLSLTEIGVNLGISRQAVHRLYSKAIEELKEFEESLGLISKHDAYEKTMKEVNEKTNAVLKDKVRVARLDPDITKLLKRLQKLVKELDI